MTSTKNELISQIIIEASSFKRKSYLKSSTKHKIYPKNSLFEDKPIDVINHKTSSTFFTDEYLLMLKTILKSPEDFKKLTQTEKHCVQSDIELLSHDDYNLKMYLHRSSTEHMLNEIFLENYKTFKNELDKNILNPVINTQRGDRVTFKYRLKLFYKIIINMLIDDGYDLERIRELTDKEIDEICEKFIVPKEIFNVFCIVLLKSAKDSLFASNSNVFNENSMSVSKHKVINHIYTNAIILFLSHSIFYKLVYKSKKAVPIESLLRSIKNFVLHNYAKIMTKSETKALTDSITGMFNCFTNCGIFTNVTNEPLSNNKTQTKLYFPNKLSNQLGRFTVPPRIIPQEKVIESNLLDCVIPSSFGSMKITASKNLLNTLNIANGKQFQINSNFKNILILLEEKYTSLKINRPIPSYNDVIFIKDKRDLLDIHHNKFAFLFMHDIEQEFTKHQKQLKMPYQYRFAADLTTAENKCLSEWRQMCNKFNDTMLERKGGLTRLEMACVLEGFPLYYTNTICSTTRCFAREYTLSRHIGCLKLLRCEGKERRLTLTGLKCLMLAYYNEDPVLKTKFQSFIRSQTISTKDQLKIFYSRNRIDYAEKEAVTYYMLLSVELKQLFDGKTSTSIMLQLDQVSSGLAFIAILFKNDELAYRTFVNIKQDGTEKKNFLHDDSNSIDSTYNYALKSFSEYYSENITNKNERVFELFTTNKKIHKYALMCYSYNQTDYGRTQDFVTKFKEVYGLSPDSLEWTCLDEISRNYDRFINHLFPNLNTLIELLNEMVELVAKDSNSVRIRSLDGEIIEWEFFKRKREIRKAYNPLDMSAKSYSLTTAVVSQEGLLVPDIPQFKRKFLSYLVHSLDACVMRKIIRGMHEQKCIVDQLHDCVLVHPNNVQEFFDVVHSIYTSEELKDYLKTHVFSIFKQSISDDKQSELDDLIKRFEKIRNKQEKHYVPDHFRMYSFES